VPSDHIKLGIDQDGMRPKSQVRTRLFAGGRRIRTLSPMSLTYRKVVRSTHRQRELDLNSRSLPMIGAVPSRYSRARNRSFCGGTESSKPVLSTAESVENLTFGGASRRRRLERALTVNATRSRTVSVVRRD
jgi:hypothetical protein